MSDRERKTDPTGKHRRHSAYGTESYGLLFVALLLLVLILIRYWHAMHWSWR